ncbi:uncharacterized protein FOMMEDRAFT_30286 [Fomitiporia mediterranea MF3/22]|uniref:uncharacterized protein n=1 Tax=Fomitiporia mediterranea (strain MF3/22) TaxID=694068 RepID=UPI00044082B5|nr:uncharacterized protein FOMMEDRAFT_30286 [Fomitiporia mediterranea MF3/22]EJD01647.1 hypothetical protein FOMMEDRAFT_30286 [Fomitiporia mediterranea MF3/22]
MPRHYHSKEHVKQLDVLSSLHLDQLHELNIEKQPPERASNFAGIMKQSYGDYDHTGKTVNNKDDGTGKVYTETTVEVISPRTGTQNQPLRDRRRMIQLVETVIAVAAERCGVNIEYSSCMNALAPGRGRIPALMLPKGTHSCLTPWRTSIRDDKKHLEITDVGSSVADKTAVVVDVHESIALSRLMMKTGVESKMYFLCFSVIAYLTTKIQDDAINLIYSSAGEGESDMSAQHAHEGSRSVEQERGRGKSVRGLNTLSSGTGSYEEKPTKEEKKKKRKEYSRSHVVLCWWFAEELLQPGHEASACPEERTVEKKQCYYCRGVGHIQADCPTLKIQGNKCYNCGLSGHYARDCTKPPGGRYGSRAPVAGREKMLQVRRSKPYIKVSAWIIATGSNFDVKSSNCLAPPGTTVTDQVIVTSGPPAGSNAPKSCYKCHETGHNVDVAV